MIRDASYKGQEIILVGGGTARFTDRPSILGADYAYTPIYREVATYRIPGDCFSKLEVTDELRMVLRFQNQVTLLN